MRFLKHEMVWLLSNQAHLIRDLTKRYFTLSLSTRDTKRRASFIYQTHLRKNAASFDPFEFYTIVALRLMFLTGPSFLSYYDEMEDSIWFSFFPFFFISMSWKSEPIIKANGNDLISLNNSLQ